MVWVCTRQQEEKDNISIAAISTVFAVCFWCSCSRSPFYAHKQKILIEDDQAYKLEVPASMTEQEVIGILYRSCIQNFLS